MTFEAWIKAEELDAARLAKLTGFHRTYTWKVLAGKRTASLPFIHRCIAVSDGKLTANSFIAPESPRARAKRRVA